MKRKKKILFSENNFGCEKDDKSSRNREVDILEILLMVRPSILWLVCYFAIVRDIIWTEGASNWWTNFPFKNFRFWVARGRFLVSGFWLRRRQNNVFISRKLRFLDIRLIEKTGAIKFRINDTDLWSSTLLSFLITYFECMFSLLINE